MTPSPSPASSASSQPQAKPLLPSGSPFLWMLALLFLLLIPIALLVDLPDRIAAFFAPEISFARPWVLAFLPLLVALPILLLQNRWRLLQRLLSVASPRLLPTLLPSFRPERLRRKGLLAAAAWFFLLLACAGPRWGTQIRILQRKGIDVVIAVDISESMLARDIPSISQSRMQRRLELARQKVRAIMEQLAGERIGLLAFSGQPALLCPLTIDYSTCAIWLDEFEPSLIPSGGTALASTIRKAIPMFATSGFNSRALFVITDGDDHEKNTLEAAKEAKKQGIRIYTLGVGSPERVTIPPEQLPPPPAGQIADPRPITTQLNEKLLQAISAETSGLYRRAEPSLRDLQALLDHARKTLEARTQEDQRQVFREERFPLFLALGLLFLLFEMAFRERKEPS